MASPNDTSNEQAVGTYNWRECGELTLSSFYVKKDLLSSIAMAVTAVLVFLVYAISRTHQVQGQHSIPWDWTRDFGPGVKWEFNHGIDMLQTTRPLVIAHRGYSGAMPEQTVEAYEMAVSAGADIIECDACLTKDLVVICTHESWINKTTNVAEVFPVERSAEYFVPDDVAGGGRWLHDFFTFDFTLEELKNLTKLEPRLYRNQNNNRLYKMATLEEMIKVAKNAKRPIGIHVEIKDPQFINNVTKSLQGLNKTFEDLVIEALHKHGYNRSRSPCFIQSFSETSLKYASTITSLPLILLIDYPGDVTEKRLQEISSFAYGIGPDKRHLVSVNSTTRMIISRSDLATVSRRLGLRIHAYTFRNEYEFLAWDYRQDPYNEYSDFFRLGIDGYFTDFPDTLHNFLAIVYFNKPSSANTASPSLFWSICFAVFNFSLVAKSLY